MMDEKYLIKNTTKAERIALIKSWIPDDDGLEDCEIDLWDMYADYINGEKEISECNESFRADYIMMEEESDMKYRFAEEKDVPLILQFIKELAEYEKMLGEVVADEDLLREWIFEKKKAEVIFALDDGKEVGFALFFHNFSTFLGRAGIYLEDLFVKPEFRGKGYGKGLIKKLAEIAVERGCGRLEWACLNWNRPSIDFYLSLGAVPQTEWTVYRVTGDTLKNMGTK